MHNFKSQKNAINIGAKWILEISQFEYELA